MSLVVSSTTDTQEAVNAAAGITDAGAATAPAEPAESPAESQPPQPTTPEEPKAEDEEPDEQDDSGEPREPARKKGGFQRKIERLERRNEELEAALVATRKPVEQPPKPLEKPRLDQFTDPEEYVDRLTDWKIEQREAQQARAAAEWHAKEQERQLTARWQERVAEFAETVSDWDEAVADTGDIMLAGDVVKAIKRSEVGPRLFYELARQPKVARRIAQLDPVDAIRELGRLEARFASSSESSEGAKPIAPHTKAPPPIRPVGGGGPTTTVPPDQMPYQQFKAWRKKHGAR